jgi:DNA repair exonuclease SbcCD ATPase subunit
MLPRQDCPVCGNHPHVYVERTNQRIIKEQEETIKKLREEIAGLHAKINAHNDAEYRRSTDDYYAGQHE